MSTGFIEITLELMVLSSSHLEPKTFYTIFLDVDQKEAQLPQKKSLTRPGQITINEALSLKVTQNDLEKAHNEAKVIIYSIQNYGRKRLFGTVTIQIDAESTHQSTLPLLSCSDKNASISLRSRIVKIQSRVSSARNSENSFLKYFPNEEGEKKEFNIFETFKGMGSRNNSRQQLVVRKEADQKLTLEQPFKQDIRMTAFQLPYRVEVSQPKTSSQSISNNLSLMEQYEKAISKDGMNNLLQMQKIEKECPQKKSSKGIVLDKIIKMGKDLNSVHQKEDLLKNDQEIERIAEEEDKIRSKDESSIFPTLEGCEQSIIHPKIRLESQTLDFVYFDSQRPPKLKVQRVESHNISRRRSIIHTFSSDRENPFPSRIVSKKDHPTTDTKVPNLIRPRQRRQNIQEWENDDNLVSIVRQMIGDVKGNLGYVKLSKLSQLRKKIKGIKDCNQHLLQTNEKLAQHQRFLTKKLQIAEEIICEKQKILAQQFCSLREQFKEVTKKLLEKYNEEILRENKIKDYQKELKTSESKVRELMNKIELKNKQVQHLKSLLAMDDQIQRDKKQPQQSQSSIMSPSGTQEKEIESRKSNEKKGKISRSTSGNKVFPRLKKDSANSSKDDIKLFSQAEIPFSSRKQLDIIKGISPNMKDFFVSFIAKPDDVVPRGTVSQISTQNQFKKGRFHRKDQSEIPSISDIDVITHGYDSVMFGKI